MGKNELDIPEFNVSQGLPEINFYNRDKILASLRLCRENITKVKSFKEEYRSLNDMKKEEVVKAKISLAFETVSAEISRANNVLALLRRDIENKKLELDDPQCLDSRVRILSTTNGVLQQKMFLMVKDYNKLQLEIKETYKAKMTRQLMAYDPNLEEDQLNELIGDPQRMGEFINQKVYNNSGALANAMADIDEKMREIKEVEKNINQLYEMLKELHQIISSQNTVIDSIAEKVDEIKDHVEKTAQTTAEAKELYMGAKEVG